MNIHGSILAPFHALGEVEDGVLSLPKFIEANTDQAKKALQMMAHQDECVRLPCNTYNQSRDALELTFLGNPGNGGAFAGGGRKYIGLFGLICDAGECGATCALSSSGTSRCCTSGGWRRSSGGSGPTAARKSKPRRASPGTCLTSRREWWEWEWCAIFFKKVACCHSAG